MVDRGKFIERGFFFVRSHNKQAALNDAIEKIKSEGVTGKELVKKMRDALNNVITDPTSGARMYEMNKDTESIIELEN